MCGLPLEASAEQATIDRSVSKNPWVNFMCGFASSFFGLNGAIVTVLPFFLLHLLCFESSVTFFQILKMFFKNKNYWKLSWVEGPGSSFSSPSSFDLFRLLLVSCLGWLDVATQDLCPETQSLRCTIRPLAALVWVQATISLGTWGWYPGFLK